MSKLTNALTMLNVLSARSVVSLQELSEILEINIRSVQRLKDDLEYSGYNIETVMGPGGGYKLINTSSIPSSALSMQERKKLKQALALLLHQNARTFDSDFIGVVSKLSQQLNYSNLDNTIAFQSVKLNVDPIHYSKTLETIEEAIELKRVLEIKYRKNHKSENIYRFQPYELVIVNQFWYLYGYDQKNRYLSLKVNRIREIEMLEKTFLKETQLPKRNTLNEYGYTIDPVHAVLEIKSLDYISEYIWGKNQTIEWISDHCFKLEVEFSNPIALRDFVLRCGDKVKVIEPEWLVNEIIEIYENAMKQYNL